MMASLPKFKMCNNYHNRQKKKKRDIKEHIITWKFITLERKVNSEILFSEPIFRLEALLKVDTAAGNSEEK